MRRLALALLLCPLLTASALAQGGGELLDAALRAALAEQASADAETARLEQAAARAQSEAGRLHAQQAAAAQAIDAAEARISAANARLQLTSAYVRAHRQQLAAEQQPVSSLLAGLATMARRPPLLVLADRGGTDELVKVRLLLASTLPVIRNRTTRLSAELRQGERLQTAALAAAATTSPRGSEPTRRSSRRRFNRRLPRKARRSAPATLRWRPAKISSGCAPSRPIASRSAPPPPGSPARKRRRSAPSRPKVQGRTRPSPMRFPPPRRSPTGWPRSARAGSVRAG